MDADPDPAYHFVANLDPAYHFDADPDTDPISQFYEDQCGSESTTVRPGASNADQFYILR
jgi:hypothetical protein